MPACRAEIARHARLADELRLPSFQWYGAAVGGDRRDARGALRGGGAPDAGGARGGHARRRSQRRAVPGDGARSSIALPSASSSTRTDMDFLEDKVANSPAGPAYVSYFVWSSPASAARTRRDGTSTAGCDASWPSTPTGSPRRRRPPRRSSCSATRRTRRPLRPARARTPAARRPPGRAVVSYGAVDRHLGGLAAVLGRRDAGGRATCARRSSATPSSAARSGGSMACVGCTASRRTTRSPLTPPPARTRSDSHTSRPRDRTPRGRVLATSGELSAPRRTSVLPPAEGGKPTFGHRQRATARRPTHRVHAEPATAGATWRRHSVPRRGE